MRNLDVLDLSWSAKDQYLATCSVDNTVIIWNALKFPGKKAAAWIQEALEV